MTRKMTKQRWGKKLRSARRKDDATLKEVAEALGTYSQLLCGIERGESEASADIYLAALKRYPELSDPRRCDHCGSLK